MNKKLLLLLPAMMLGLVGCNGGTPTSDSESKGPESTSTGSQTSKSTSGESPFVKDKKPHPWISEDHAVTLTWDNTFSYTDQIAQMIADFNELEPNVTIVNNKISGNYSDIETKEITGMATLEYASLVTCYPDHVADYLDYGAAVNFEDYIYGEYGFTEDEYYDIVVDYLDEGRSFYEDGLYVMPQSKSIEPMYYNSKILGKTIAGVNGDKPIDEKYINSLTWEELFDNFCPKFVEWNKTNKLIKLDESEWGDTKFGAVVGYDSDDNFAITLCEQYGLPYTSFNEATGYGSVDFNFEDNAPIFKKLKNAYNKGYLITKGSAPSQSYTNNSFTAEQMLFCIGSTGGLKYQLDSNKQFTTMVGRLPQAAEGVKEAVISQGPGICILTHGDEYEDLAAWAFIKSMMEPEETLYWASETGYAPVRYSTYEMDDYIELCDPTGKEPFSVEELKARVFKAYDDTKDILFVSPAFKGSATCRTQFGALLTKILLKDTAECTDEFMKQAFEEAIQACLKAIA